METLVPDVLQGLLFEHRYLALFFLTLAQGPLAMTLGGFLLRLDYFTFWPTYLVLMAGDLVGDTLWYLVGYHAGRRFVVRFGKFFSITETTIAKTEEVFHRYTNRILLISKITMGFGFAIATLLVAGMSRIPFRSYILFNAVGQLFWTGLLLAVGYFLGDLYVHFNEGLHRLFIFAVFIMVLLALYGFGNYLRKRNFNNA
ncbi:hypothetical protein A2950_00670 [Candidatus Kaiserbacteria bacterium RIFCSPLOWO2_01_FULL_55_19]|uniref:VTT domain-containing protein n=1 Tax=Candidatus Kaiserbacteria bacterium RIFCSPLOWO2_01_FULL_55_19 TaxID=1798516 RepID=A0A1F6ES38_9BACT|nr:MAG: hypothetical protein A2950_00670 [Candidatus Kaiserbacteria bacterium RIFCSPLOWO2_01_FULL_55_19]